MSDTSAISERIFSGQFTRWTIQLEIQDAFLFSTPYRKNWKFILDDTEIDTLKYPTYTYYDETDKNFKTINTLENTSKDDELIKQDLLAQEAVSTK